MYGSGVKPLKKLWNIILLLLVLYLMLTFPNFTSQLMSTSDQPMIDYIIRAMGHVIEKFELYVDLLAEAKRFSLITQEKNVDVIKMLNAVETTESNYERLLKRIKENSKYILNLPNLKIVIEALKSNEDDDGIPRY